MLEGSDGGREGGRDGGAEGEKDGRKQGRREREGNGGRVSERVSDGGREGGREGEVIGRGRGSSGSCFEAPVARLSLRLASASRQCSAALPRRSKSASWSRGATTSSASRPRTRRALDPTLMSRPFRQQCSHRRRSKVRGQAAPAATSDLIPERHHE